MKPAASIAIAEYRTLEALPGLLVVGSLTLMAFALASAPFAPFTLGSGVHPLGSSSIAILLGMAVAGFLRPQPRWCAGIRFASRVILPAGIVLLGARLAFSDLMKVGVTGLVLALVSIATCALVVWALVSWFSLPVKLTTLVGVGTAICGGSAIAAAAPVIEADDEDISWSVASVALLGLVAMFALPLVGHALDVDPVEFGMWAGLTIQQTPQVVAAGLAYGGDAGEVATLVKLVRVTLLAPVVFLLGWFYARQRQSAGGGRVAARVVVPPFVLGFLAMVVLSSIGWLSFEIATPGADGEAVSLRELARYGDRIALAMAMAAIGLETRLGRLRREGWKPLAVGLTVAIAATIVSFLAISAAGEALAS